MKNLSFIAITLCLLITGASLAEAHAFLDHADPKVGSTLSSSPSTLKIWFTEELEGAFSKIKVFDAKGQEVDKKDVKVDSSNKALMSVSVPKLTVGTYKVEWSAVAVDTHHTTGTFTFTELSPHRQSHHDDQFAHSLPIRSLRQRNDPGRRGGLSLVDPASCLCR
jgi:methionine-rich copper-binding protein CopC